MKHHPELTFAPIYAKQPGWKREAVHRDGGLIGYLDRHESAERIEWLVCDPQWNDVGERSYGDRGEALDALVADADRARS